MFEPSQGGPAPSGPSDLTPTWTSSAKDLVTTALGAGRVWATIGHGILNEVYWPSTGEPQIRDLAFIVAGAFGWVELKRAGRYRIGTPSPEILLPTVVHSGTGYELTLEFVPDPARDAVLLRYRLKGEGCRLYVLLAPHLGQKSDANTATVEHALHAEGGGACLCLMASKDFSRASAGHVGTSDGWQDFDRNGAMTWAYGRAGPGNVALMGELAENNGLLSLAFSGSREGAGTLARSCIAAGYDTVSRAALKGWRDWAEGVAIDAPDLPAECLAQARRSAAVIRAHEDRTFPGAIVASLSVPWGNSRGDLGGYHLVWARDAVNSGLALLTIGQVDDARRMLAYLVAMQHPDGHWAQNFYPDGRDFWKGLQLDEVGFPVLLAAKLAEGGNLDMNGDSGLSVRRMVERAVGFIAQNGPLTEQDRWEEVGGLSPYSVAVAIAALVAGAGWLSRPERDHALSLADDWNARIEDWSFSHGTALAERFGVPGHYVRIAPDPRLPLAEQMVDVRNRGGLRLPATDLVSLEFLALVRFGLRAADDPAIRGSLAVADGLLAVELPTGRAWHRYNEDGYGEHADGAPFDGSGVGRAWPLLAGERGHLALAAGEDPLPYLAAMAAMTGPGGMMPEQVWDSDPLPHLELMPGQPTGAAMPLVWAHAEYLKLVCATRDRQPVERLESVEARYGHQKPQPARRHWRAAVPFVRCAAGTKVIVEDARPFVLRHSLDGWSTASDVVATPLPFGLFGVHFEGMEQGRELTFAISFEDNWEGVDRSIEWT